MEMPLKNNHVSQIIKPRRLDNACLLTLSTLYLHMQYIDLVFYYRCSMSIKEKSSLSIKEPSHAAYCTYVLIERASPQGIRSILVMHIFVEHSASNMDILIGISG